MAKNDMLKRQRQREQIIQEATRQTFVQYMTDMLILTLNDPSVMGKNVFGYGRIKKILEAQGRYYDTFFEALTKSDEADYCREKIDETIKRICGKEEFVPFLERYEWLKEVEYRKGEYGKVNKKNRP